MPPSISRSKMMHISNCELLAAMKLTSPALAAVRRETRTKNWDDAFKAWGDYFAHRRSPRNMPNRGHFSPVSNPLAEADRLVEHEIQGWHEITHKFGKKVDFNADWGVTGIYGTHYWHWAEPLRYAFRQTGQECYPACFDDLFNQWYCQRDRLSHPIPRMHVIFNELGIGCRSPLFIDHYFEYRKTGLLGWRTHMRMLKTILGGCRWLYLYEKNEPYRANNQQMCGSWALVYAGGLFPEFKEAASWVSVGAKRLLQHLDRDFYDDGGNYERAAGYGGWCARMIEDLLQFSKMGNCLKVPAGLHERVTRMYDWFLATTTPLGETQGFNDGGFSRDDETFSSGVSFTGQGKYLWPIRSRLKSVNGLRPRHPGYTSIDLRPSGFAVMRSDWDEQARYMLINYGPGGGVHTHPGLLDFALYAYGQPLAIEASRWGSYDHPLNATFRSPGAHNQVVVDKRPMNRQDHRGEDVTWATGKHIDYFTAKHRCYEEWRVQIRRSITFLKPDYYLISDTILEGLDHHCYTWYLHSPFKWSGTKRRCVTRGAPGLQVIPARPAEIRHLQQGTSYEASDNCPLEYPNRYWIGFQKWLDDERSRAVVYDVALVPHRKIPGSVAVSRCQARLDGEEVGTEIARGVRIERGNRVDLVIYGVGDGEVECEGLTFRGKMCVLSLQGRRLTQVSVVDGGNVRYGARVLIRGEVEGLSTRKL